MTLDADVEIGGQADASIQLGSRPAPPERPRPKDPYVGLYFWVEIDGILVANFMECSPLTIETEVFEYAEGGLNLYTHKLPVRTKYGNITLKRGIDAGQDLYSWYVGTLNGKMQRKNVTISLYTSAGGSAVRSYHLVNAYPVKWTGPDLKTDAGAVTVETLEFVHEGLILGQSIPPPSPPFSASASSSSSSSSSSF